MKPRQTLNKSWMLIVLVAAQCTACATQYNLPNNTVENTFPDPKVQQLVHAVVDGDRGKAQALVKAGTDVNYVGNQGGTPLMWAVLLENQRAVELLLGLGANPNQATFVGPKGLDTHWSAVTFAAVNDRHNAILKLLLDKGGGPNGTTSVDSVRPGLPESGYSMLLMAQRYAAYKNVQLLVERGADVNYVTPSGETIVDTLHIDGQFQWILYMLQHGYSHDLEKLAPVIQRLYEIDDSKVCKEKTQILLILRDRGIALPVPPALNGLPAHVGKTDPCLPDFYPKGFSPWAGPESKPVN